MQATHSPLHLHTCRCTEQSTRIAAAQGMAAARLAARCAWPAAGVGWACLVMAGPAIEVARRDSPAEASGGADVTTVSGYSAADSKEGDAPISAAASPPGAPSAPEALPEGFRTYKAADWAGVGRGSCAPRVS